MMSFGVVAQPTGGVVTEPATFDSDGLTYVSDTYLSLLEKTLSVLVLQEEWVRDSTRAMRAVPGLGKLNASDDLRGWADGYVVMVQKTNPMEFLVSSSLADIVESARTGATHAILRGPPNLLVAATAYAKTKSSTWIVPALAVGAGALLLFWFVRR